MQVTVKQLPLNTLRALSITHQASPISRAALWINLTVIMSNPIHLISPTQFWNNLTVTLIRLVVAVSINLSFILTATRLQFHMVQISQPCKGNLARGVG